MADIDLKAATPDTTLPSTGFLFGADSQSAASPSVYSTQTVATALLGSTTLTGATVTTSSPVLDLAQTWNDAAASFTALKFNATDTASASGSMLLDLQVGTVSAFKVSKGGSLNLGLNVSGTNQTAANVTISGPQGTGTGAGGSIVFQVAPAGSSGTAQNALATALTILGTGDTRIAYDRALDGDGNWAFQGVFNGSLIFHAAYSLAWAAGGANKGASKILTLFCDAANTLALRNGANAQAFRVYNTTDGTNLERFAIEWSSNVVRLGIQSAGTGTARALRVGSLEFGGGGQSVAGALVQLGFYSGKVSVTDAVNFELATTTGTKIGTGATQKLGFWNATPVVQPTAVADATDNATAITQLNALLAHMRTVGLIAT